MVNSISHGVGQRIEAPGIEDGLQKQVQQWLDAFPLEAPVVVVPVFNAYKDMLDCVEGLLANTPSGIPILALDDASTDARIPDALNGFSTDERFMYVRKPVNSGFVGTVNLAFAWCAPRDVVVVNSDVVVPPAWLERLRAAAYFRSTIATATPFTNHGSILSLPYRDTPVGDLVGGKTVEEVDARVQEASLRIYPIIPTAVGHCIYFKRSALDAVGYFDPAFAPGYGEEVDFSQRAVMTGFSHVLADDLFVFHKGSRSFEGSNGQEAKRTIQAAHEELVRERYPWYMLWSARAAKSEQGPLARAIERAQTALLGYRIAIDATCVGGPVTGTQVLTLELIRALATMAGRNAHLTVIVNDHIDRAALLGVDQLVDQVVTPADLQNSPQPCFNLVHRPFQVRTLDDLIFLSKIACRFVVSQLDFIAFANPSYAAGPQEWERYRRLTHLTCDTADGIVFISHDVAQDAAHQGMNVEAERARVIFLGVDHYHLAGAVPPSAAADNGDLLEPPFILVLGATFRHKNRVFALRLLQELIETYRWNGKLVLAGPNVTYGGSEAEEELLLQRNPELRSQVVYLSAVNEPSRKLWLLKNASLVLYPSTCEGFGMIPFEAAAAGTPTLTARTTSLAEVLGDQVMYLDVFDPQVGAQVVWSLLSDATVAAKQVAAIQARMANYTWSAAAAQTWDFYRQILALPPRSHERIMQQALEWEPRRRLAAGTEALPDWRRRLALAFYIGFAEGLGPLFAEIQQYVRWLMRPRR